MGEPRGEVFRGHGVSLELLGVILACFLVCLAAMGASVAIYYLMAWFQERNFRRKRKLIRGW